MKKLLQPTLNLAIILVYIVIIAGSVVRMTGSGMGCPDWPKCFGYMVPPTEASQLEWKPNHEYKKGQVIILNEELQVVRSNFISAEAYQPKNWEKYTKHNYTTFNPIHTWIEYINRLATVLFGFPILLLVVCGIAYFNENKKILWLSLAALFSVGFEAWLGKVVVDNNLLPIKVTLHVLFVFFIIAFLLGLKYISIPQKNINAKPYLIKMGIIALILTLIQVILGTQVRQYIDVQMTENAYLNKSNWLSTPPTIFYIHRSFSILIVLVNAFWIYKTNKEGIKILAINWVGVFLGLEILSGIVLYYLDFPLLSQPIHLLLGSLVFGTQFYSLLIFSKK